MCAHRTLPACLVSLCTAQGERDRLPGWMGETHSVPEGARLRGGTLADGTDAQKPWIEPLGWAPRAFLYHGFMTKEECLHLIHLAAPHMQKSTVADNQSGKSYQSQIRTSSGMFLRRGQDSVVKAIEERIAAFAMVPVDHGEGIQVLHYEEGQKYDAHFDYFHDQNNQKNGGQRIATVLLYLTDVEEGGETVFPSAKDPPQRKEHFSQCGSRGVAVKPRLGDALLFWSLNTDNQLDPTSLHAGCPVISGDKWTATKWMRVGKFKM
mmetsp:Transcript_8193/g.27220  ORF Transcript_8193/g.27220 Transcript_8193/m.27220 type:complete len:265 (-) Transcript_8193:2804-3598(-)